MRDDRDDRIERIARELKQPARTSASFDERLMRTVRRLPRHARFGLWSRWTGPGRFTMTPLSWGFLAAALATIAVLGKTATGDVPRAAAPIGQAAPATKEAPQAVQFVLVAPDARKVAVVGDFNGWDASHAGYQAEHRGGGVWAVTAALPVGHHRYSFVVDDSVWVADPIAPRAVDSDFGVTNSAIVVQSHE
jgi:1,4-alpha-glucan branching enzyme